MKWSSELRAAGKLAGGAPPLTPEREGALVRAASRGEAIALAARHPDVTWGSAEVRGVRRFPNAP